MVLYGRSGRVVYRTCLENKSLARDREFESHLLRITQNSLTGVLLYRACAVRVAMVLLFQVMARTPLFAWEGREYRFEDKSADWYWALGIIASVLFGNALLAIVIAAGAISVAIAAAKPTRVHRFAIYEDGVAIDNDLYPFENMLHFSVLEYIDETLPPSLSIKTKSFLAPHLLIPIVDHDPIDIYEFISFHLPEGRHDESIVDRLVELFRI